MLSATLWENNAMTMCCLKNAAAAIASGALLFAGPALAQQADDMTEMAAEQTALEARASQVVDIINGESGTPLYEVFTQAFLSQVPATQLQTIFAQLTGQFGPALSVESLGSPNANRSALSIRMEGAIASGGIAIDPAQGNRISELLFQTFEPVNDSPEKIEADLSALSGKANALFAKLSDDGVIEPVFAHNSDQPLALGSAFKLYVLSALAQSVADGERSWDDVVTLSQRSFPSGQMQDWPDDAPVTLQTLATMMISISDNTATDQLIAELGRETIEAELIASGNSDPSLTIPFLKTRELFAMRGVSEEFIERYRAADDDGQRVILANLSEEDVLEDKIREAFANDRPGAIDIEWFASPLDLASLLRGFTSSENATARSVMGVNLHMSDQVAARWDYVGYKGGSEPGVINLTWLLRDSAGDYWIATVGWNDPERAVELSTLETIAQRIIALIAID